MRAGDALGLLAGLGALNAIRGGREGTGKRFTGLMDMLDGGGAGASGDRFEGGGLLSILGNLFAKPLEAQQNVENIAARTSARSALRPKLRPEGLLSEAQKEQIVMDQIVNPDVYNIGQGGEFAGSMLAPRATTEQSAAMEDAYSTTAPLSAPAPSYATMPMDEAGRGMPSATPTPSGLIAPQADAAPSMTSPTDPLIGGTRNPSAYRPIDMSLQEMRPIVDPRGASPMSYEEYVPYISDLYRKEYGTAPTEQQLRSAYEKHVQNTTSGSQSIEPQSPANKVSDLPYADQIVAARQAIMREQITPDMLENIFGVDFAREVMSGIQMMGGKTAVPNIPLGPLSIQRLHQTMPITRFN